MVRLLEALVRKARQVGDDGVLRRWLVERALGRVPGEPAYRAHRPPYLSFPLPDPGRPVRRAEWVEVPLTDLLKPLSLPLPGRTVTVRSSTEADALFEQTFSDTETLLGLHRFAWLPLVDGTMHPAWVEWLWRAWHQRFGVPDDGWPWHPYTAAERAINILSYGKRNGFPGPLDHTVELLATHGRVIAERLEYFGDHHTSNHLAANGRGLYFLGLELGLEPLADAGARILLEEARRIFRPSGVLREGSSHYHLLLCRQYASSWLAARAHRRPEAEELESITRRALAIAAALPLPGGLPLIGDISPDCPPEFLLGLLPGGSGGWVDLLDAEERTALESLKPPASPALDGDGWLRAEFGPWSGLWHASPEGWSHMPGHGHQDTGGFELHFRDEAVFVDPGRGAYGESGAAALYRSGRVHNTLLVDDLDPYPANKPYYDDSFRLRIGGHPPRLERSEDGVMLRHWGYGRLGGVGAVERTWRFHGSRLVLTDQAEGAGHHRLTRRLHTALPVERNGESMVLRGRHGCYHVSGAPMDVEPVTLWRAYGRGEPGTALVAESRVRMPWKASLEIEVR